MSRTWPCSYLYDISNQLHVRGAKHHKGCQRWQDSTPPGRCDEIADHIARECMWSGTFSSARAIHFKGGSKPWKSIPPRCEPGIKRGPLTVALSQSPATGARPLDRSLRATTVATTAVSATRSEDGQHLQALAVRDDLRWNATARACESASLAAAVGWNDGAALPRRCCSFETLLKAEWHALLRAVSQEA